SGPESPGDRLVDDDYVPVIDDVVPADIATFQQPHSHGPEITWRHNVDEYRKEVGVFGFLLAFCRDPPTAIAAHGKVVGYSRRFDARDHRSAAHNVLPYRGAPGCVSAIIVIDRDCRRAGGLEAKVDIHHTEKAAEQQPGADHQDASQSNFGNDQSGAQPPVFHAVTEPGS